MLMEEMYGRVVGGCGNINSWPEYAEIKVRVKRKQGRQSRFSMQFLRANRVHYFLLLRRNLHCQLDIAGKLIKLSIE